MVELHEIIRLHNHVIEFQEGQSLFHALLVALCRKHAIDREMRPDIPQQFNVIQSPQPVAIIDHQRPALIEINKALHLFLEAVAVMLDHFIGKHLAHIAPSRRIPYRTGAATDKADRPVTGPLHVRHGHKAEEMSDMKAVRGGIKADIKSNLFIFQQGAHLFFIGALLDKSTFL